MIEKAGRQRLPMRTNGVKVKFLVARKAGRRSPWVRRRVGSMPLAFLIVNGSRKIFGNPLRYFCYDHAICLIGSEIGFSPTLISRTTSMGSSVEQILSELQQIRKLLTPAPAPAPPKGLSAEFKFFLSQYKVLGLAVGFILGLYLGALVKALVTDLLLPVITLVLPASDINTFAVGPFGVGDFANAVITFIIVAFVIFIIVKVAKHYKID